MAKRGVSMILKGVIFFLLVVVLFASLQDDESMFNNITFSAFLKTLSEAPSIPVDWLSNYTWLESFGLGDSWITIMNSSEWKPLFDFIFLPTKFILFLIIGLCQILVYIGYFMSHFFVG